MHNAQLEALSREELLRLVEMYAKNWLAMDGVWFQSVEKKYGMEEAMYHDREAWRRFTVVEARRIKAFLGLSEPPGLEGLAKALRLRFYANLGRDEIRMEDGALIYRMLTCRVQSARTRKQMPLHPCKSVGEIEYGEFARAIDPRIACQCLSCYPEIRDESCSCAWRFTMEA